MSSDGANAGSMVTYLAQKGQLEDEWKKLECDTLTILRPGLLDRGDKATTMEKMFGVIAKPLPCATVAKAIRNRCRDLMYHANSKENKELVLRNGEITEWSERLPIVNLVATTEGAGVSSYN